MAALAAFTAPLLYGEERVFESLFLPGMMHTAATWLLEIRKQGTWFDVYEYLPGAMRQVLHAAARRVPVPPAVLERGRARAALVKVPGIDDARLWALVTAADHEHGRQRRADSFSFCPRCDCWRCMCLPCP